MKLKKIKKIKNNNIQTDKNKQINKNKDIDTKKQNKITKFKLFIFII